MAHTQNEFPDSMLAPQNLFGDGPDTEHTESEGAIAILRHSFAGVAGFIIGAGIAHHGNLGPGGAELVPMAGAGAGVLLLNVRDWAVRVLGNDLN